MYHITLAKQSVFVVFRPLREKSLGLAEKILAEAEEMVQAGFQMLTLLLQGCSPIPGADLYRGIHQKSVLSQRQGHLEAIPGV
jgi:hypothetical protein